MNTALGNFGGYSGMPSSYYILTLLIQDILIAISNRDMIRKQNLETKLNPYSYLSAPRTDVNVWYTIYLNHTAVTSVRPMSKIDLFLVIDAIYLAACSGQHLLWFDLKLIGLWYQ